MSELVFKNLSGLWQISRIIPGFGSFEGQAEFKALDKDRYEYTEKGVLKREDDGFESEAFQSYFYIFNGTRILINFGREPEKLFLSLDIKPDPENAEGFIAQDTHLCLQDNYDALFRFQPDRIETRYKVKGPKKDHTIKSVLTRT